METPTMWAEICKVTSTTMNKAQLGSGNSRSHKVFIRKGVVCMTKPKISSRFYTQEGPMSTPSSSKGTGVLTARQIAEYKRKQKAKKKKKEKES